MTSDVRQETVPEVPQRTETVIYEYHLINPALSVPTIAIPVSCPVLRGFYPEVFPQFSVQTLHKPVPA